MTNSAQLVPQLTGIEAVPCNLCGADSPELLFKLPVWPQHRGIYNRDEWDIVRCRQCGLVYETPRPDAAALAYYYTFDNAGDFNFVQDWFISNADLNRATCWQILRAMRRYQTPGKLLDIGCGAGTFLVEAQQGGYQVAGQEVAPYFVEYCRTKLGLTMYQGNLDDLYLPPASYDCVTAFDVIEHHPNPRHLLDQMYTLVKPGGLVVLSTHDIGNFFARLYGPNWRHMGAIGHLTYFSRPTLQSMLEVSGFHVLHVAGGHTVDGSSLAEARNAVTKFLRVVVFRSLILGVYKPLAERLPALTHWQLNLPGGHLDHKKLLTRAGKQVVMNDNMVILARRPLEEQA